VLANNDLYNDVNDILESYDCPTQKRDCGIFSMIRYLLRGFRFSGIILILVALIGCVDSESDFENEYLIRLGDRVVTVLDFNEAFEIAKTAYPHNIRSDSEDLRKAKLRLFNQMIVETILLKRADELGIQISEAAVQKAVAAIKNDYPEGVFEETLLEYAVSYQELKDQIVITPEEISRFYKDKYKAQNLDADDKDSKDINEAIIENLRRKKLEEAYQGWIKDLKANYTIDINKAQWKRITGLESFSDQDIEG
jgi:hypothetical protein